MTKGRPVKIGEVIDRLEAHFEEKERLKAILAHLSGECTVEEACERLGIGRSRFFELRERALQGALEGLLPGPAGRPSLVDEIDAEDVDALAEHARFLERELRLADARIDLAFGGIEGGHAPIEDPIERARKRLRKDERKGRRKDRRK
jgi:hypothetical protein